MVYRRSPSRARGATALARSPLMWYRFHMAAKTLTQAVAKARLLPLADQERIGRDLGRYVDGLSDLREKLDEGIRSLDAGLAKELDIEDLIARANAGHAKP